MKWWGGERVGLEKKEVHGGQMRYMDRIFCLKDKGNRIRVCLPGCEIVDVWNTGDPIIGEEMELSFLGNNPIMGLSKTNSEGRFQFEVNEYGEK